MGELHDYFAAAVGRIIIIRALLAVVTRRERNFSPVLKQLSLRGRTGRSPYVQMSNRGKLAVHVGFRRGHNGCAIRSLWAL